MLTHTLTKQYPIWVTSSCDAVTKSISKYSLYWQAAGEATVCWSTHYGGTHTYHWSLPAKNGKNSPFSLWEDEYFILGKLHHMH